MHVLATRFVPLAALAVAGIAVAGWTALASAHQPLPPPLAGVPPQGPWAQRVSTTGLIEGDGEVTRIGVPEQGIIATVAVRVGQVVRSGDLLLGLDDRQVLAELAVAEAEVAAMRGELAAATAAVTAAEAGLARLAALPRPEDAAPFTARLGVAEAQLADARERRQRIERLGTGGASVEEIATRRGVESIAAAQAASARADLAHAALPAWEHDLALTRAEVAAARGRLAAATARIAVAEARAGAIHTRHLRLTVRAPGDATVLAVGARPGAMASPGDQDLVVLADLRRLFVRLEIDESQVARLRPGAAAQAWLRGDRSQPLALEFARLEPRAEARRALAGKPGERLDGRAVQALYRILDPPEHLRPGLLLEADIEAQPR